MVQRELEHGLVLASVAAARSSPLHTKGNRIYSKMKVLLPTLDGLNKGDRTRLELKLHDLRATLDRAPAEVIGRQMTCAALASEPATKGSLPYVSGVKI